MLPCPLVTLTAHSSPCVISQAAVTIQNSVMIFFPVCRSLQLNHVQPNISGPEWPLAVFDQCGISMA